MPLTHQKQFAGICIAFLTLAVGPSPSHGLDLSRLNPKPLIDRALVLTHEVQGVAMKITDLLPTPQVIFSISKNMLVGYPVEAVLSAVNLFCSAALSVSRIEPKTSPAIDQMNFVLMTRTQNYSIPLHEANKLWHHEAFNASRQTVVLVTGWTSNINKTNSAKDALYKAYMCRGGVNFVVS